MIEILDPTVEAAKQPIAYVPRPESLKGKRMAWSRTRSSTPTSCWLKIGEILKAEYGAAETRMFRKHNVEVPAHEEIIEEAKRGVDVIVAGVGD